LRSYIPRSLNEVYDPERDIDAVNRGEGNKLIYADTIGLVEAHPGEKSNTKQVRFDSTLETEDEAYEDENTSTEDGDDSNKGKDVDERRPRGHRHEDRETKKVCSLRYLFISLLIHIRAFVNYSRNARKSSKRSRGSDESKRCQKLRKRRE